MEAVVAVPNQKACRQKGVCLQWKVRVSRRIDPQTFAFYLAAEFRRP